jgi:hypothetical protein
MSLFWPLRVSPGMAIIRSTSMSRPRERSGAGPAPEARAATQQAQLIELRD